MTEAAPSFGVNLMPSLWDGRPAVTGRDQLARRRRLLGRMREAGLDHVMIGDHVMFQGGLGNDGMIDAASALTANEELDVYLAVYLLVLRHPLLVARQLITLDRAALRPVPEVPVPLIVGGRSDAALRRAGRLGDGWLGIWVSARRFAEAVETVAAQAKDAARPEVGWRHGMTFWCAFDTSAARAQARVAPVMEGFYQVPFDRFERYVPAGPPAAVAEQVAPYVEAGCTTLNFIPFAARDGAASDEAAIDAVAEVRQLLGRPGPERIV